MTQKILVSDSDTKLVAFLQERIKDRRFQFTLALCLEQILEQLNSEKFFAAIVDFNKKDSTGKRLIEYTIERKIPTIVTLDEVSSKTYSELSSYPIIDYVIDNNYAGKHYLADLLQGLEYFNNKKVLICYDNKDSKVLESLVQTFNSLLFEPILATSVTEAKNLLANEEYIKIAYIDEDLKDGSGIDFCQEIKENISYKDMVVLAGAQNRTNLCELKEIRGRFFKSGVVNFISVPVDKEEFNTNLLSMMKIIKQKKRLDTYVETVDKYVLISITNLSGIIVYASDAFCKMSGYSKGELIGKSHNIIRHPEMPKSIYKDMWETIKDGKVWSGEIKNRKKDGTFYWVNAKVEPIHDSNGKIMGYQSIRFDITDKKLVEELSIKDSLLGIYNRRKFDEIVNYQYNLWSRFKKVFSIIFIDLDDFKNINDLYGHSVGDRVLVDISQVIINTIRDVDTIFRWGGEELVVVCPHTDEKGALVLAEKIRKNVEDKKHDLIGKKTVSIGVASINLDDSVESLVDRADNALYKAKTMGKNRVIAF